MVEYKRLSWYPFQLSSMWQRSNALSTLEGYSGYGAEQGEKVCHSWVYIDISELKFFNKVFVWFITSRCINW